MQRFNGLKWHGGVLQIEDAYGTREVSGTFTCYHCNKTHVLAQKSARQGIIGRDNFDEVGMVCACHSMAICNGCARTNDDWITQIERMEQDYYRQQQNAKVMGL